MHVRLTYYDGLSAYIHRTCASCTAAVVLLLLLILVAPVPAGDSRAIWRSQKPAALAAHSRHPLPAQHRCEHSALYCYTYFPLPASTATVGAATLTLGGTQLCKRDLGMKKKKKRESKQEKKCRRCKIEYTHDAHLVFKPSSTSCVQNVACADLGCFGW